jgi:hypothetical protein
MNILNIKQSVSEMYINNNDFKNDIDKKLNVKGFILKEELIDILLKYNIYELSTDDDNFIINNFIILKELDDMPYYIQVYKFKLKEYFDIFREYFLTKIYLDKRYKTLIRKIGSSSKLQFLKKYYEDVTEYWLEIENEMNILLLKYWDTYICAKDISITKNYINSFLFYIASKQTFLLRNLINNALPIKIPSHCMEKVLQTRSQVINYLKNKYKNNTFSNKEINKLILNYLVVPL